MDTAFWWGGAWFLVARALVRSRRLKRLHAPSKTRRLPHPTLFTPFRIAVAGTWVGPPPVDLVLAGFHELKKRGPWPISYTRHVAMFDGIPVNTIDVLFEIQVVANSEDLS